MSVKDRTTTQVNALEGTRDANVGLKYDARGSQPWYEKLVNWLWHLGQASAFWGLVKEDDATALTIALMPGRFTFNGTTLAYAGGATTVTNNDTTYVWVYNLAGVATIGTAIDATGWPTYKHIKLAEVTASGGDITAIDDRRADHLMQVNSVTPQIPLMSLRNEDGTVMDATGGAGKWHLVAGGWGTGTLTVEAEAVQNTSDNADLSFELVVPENYVSGMKLQLIINALYVLAGGTTITATIDIEAYKLGNDGTVGADLNATAAQNLTDTAADYTFTITETGLAAGDRLTIVVRGAISEGGDAGTIKAVIGSIRPALGAA